MAYSGESSLDLQLGLTLGILDNTKNMSSKDRDDRQYYHSQIIDKYNIPIRNSQSNSNSKSDQPDPPKQPHQRRHKPQHHDEQDDEASEQNSSSGINMEDLPEGIFEDQIIDGASSTSGLRTAMPTIDNNDFTFFLLILFLLLSLGLFYMGLFNSHQDNSLKKKTRRVTRIQKKTSMGEYMYQFLQELDVVSFVQFYMSALLHILKDSFNTFCETLVAVINSNNTQSANTNHSHKIKAEKKSGVDGKGKPLKVSTIEKTIDKLDNVTGGVGSEKEEEEAEEIEDDDALLANHHSILYSEQIHLHSQSEVSSVAQSSSEKSQGHSGEGRIKETTSHSKSNQSQKTFPTKAIVKDVTVPPNKKQEVSTAKSYTAPPQNNNNPPQQNPAGNRKIVNKYVKPEGTHNIGWELEPPVTNQSGNSYNNSNHGNSYQFSLSNEQSSKAYNEVARSKTISSPLPPLQSRGSIANSWSPYSDSGSNTSFPNISSLSLNQSVTSPLFPSIPVNNGSPGITPLVLGSNFNASSPGRPNTLYNDSILSDNHPPGILSKIGDNSSWMFSDDSFPSSSVINNSNNNNNLLNMDFLDGLVDFIDDVPDSPVKRHNNWVPSSIGERVHENREDFEIGMTSITNQASNLTGLSPDAPSFQPTFSQWTSREKKSNYPSYSSTSNNNINFTNTINSKTSLMLSMTLNCGRFLSPERVRAVKLSSNWASITTNSKVIASEYSVMRRSMASPSLWRVVLSVNNCPLQSVRNVLSYHYVLTDNSGMDWHWPEKDISGNLSLSLSTVVKSKQSVTSNEEVISMEHEDFLAPAYL